MTRTEWKYEFKSYQIADTGDYDAHIEFSNGRFTLQSNGDEMEEEDCKKFCELLNLMPDIFVAELDATEFLYHNEKKNAEVGKKALQDIFQFQGKRIEYLKLIASQALDNIF